MSRRRMSSTGFATAWYDRRPGDAAGSVARHSCRRAPGKAEYQYTLWSLDDGLYDWVPKALAAVRSVPGLVDVTSDREQGGLQLNANINRDTASRLNVSISDIDNALENAFSQRQFSTIYGDRNQYKVIIEVDPKLQRIRAICRGSMCRPSTENWCRSRFLSH